MRAGLIGAVAVLGDAGIGTTILGTCCVNGQDIAADMDVAGHLVVDLGPLHRGMWGAAGLAGDAEVATLLHHDHALQRNDLGTGTVKIS